MAAKAKQDIQPVDTEELLREMARIHEEYLAQMRQLQQRQNALLKEVVRRIEVAKAERLTEEIKEDEDK
ncbi:hypothetical protein AMJ57_00095 [Parcubacteria bacterium SG8_24]|nr:MAG: hypothetical protein AMJ57_00095 [Parcubacteria bacterium SG8_24]